MNKHLILPALLFTPTLLAQSIERQHGVHEHGHATLNLAVSGHELQIQLETPAMNLLGFEHAARSEQDREKLHHAVAQLKQPLKLIAANPEAACEVEKKTIHSSLLDDEDHDEHEHEKEHDHDEHEHKEDHEHEKEHGRDEHEHEKDHDHDEHEHEKEHMEHADEHEHDHEQHADFEIELEYHCDQPERLTDIDTHGLFKAFPGFEELEVQWITDAAQGGAELNPGSTRIKLR